MRDRVTLAINAFKTTFGKSPEILVLDRVSYAKLVNEVLGDDNFEEDITKFAGLIVHIEPQDNDKVEVL